MSWLDRFIKLGPSHWLVVDQCLTGLSVARNGEIRFIPFSQMGQVAGVLVDERGVVS